MTKKTKLLKEPKNNRKTFLKISKIQNWPPKSKKAKFVNKKIKKTKWPRKQKLLKEPKNNRNIFSNISKTPNKPPKSKKINLKKYLRT